jgi:hypothetical protein
MEVQVVVALTGLLAAAAAAAASWRASRSLARRDEIVLLREENARLHERLADQEQELQECRARLREESDR